MASDQVATESVTTSPADTELGTFSEAGPWNIDPARLTWRRGLAGVRARLNASLPSLTRRRTLPPFRRMGTTVRHLGGALGRGSLRESRLGSPEPIRTAGISRRLRVAAENLGPTYIKLGQIVSSREGIFPSELVAEFKRCRNQVRPEPWAVVHQVIEEELGRPPESVFATIDREPPWPPPPLPRCTPPRWSMGPRS